MKIPDLNPTALNNLATGSIHSSSSIGAYGRGGRSSYGPAPDQVQLSGASRIASSAMAAHAARLNQLKNLVAAGSYNPPADIVAKSMLSEELSRNR
jgi:hypothetical protein